MLWARFNSSSGIHSSPELGNLNDSGMMPTTVRGWPPMISCFPIIAGSAP